jgi:hypothetical protein
MSNKMIFSSKIQCLLYFIKSKAMKTSPDINKIPCSKLQGINCLFRKPLQDYMVLHSNKINFSIHHSRDATYFSF